MYISQAHPTVSDIGIIPRDERGMRNTKKERGLEDLGIGYCHTHGVGWRGNVTAGEVLGLNLTGHVALEQKNISSSNSCSNCTHNSDMIPFYWTQLVRRPKCVDSLTVTMGNVTQDVLVDPADFETSKEKIMIKRKTCETETLNIKIENTRGGFNANINIPVSNVNVIRRKPDEYFEYNVTLEGIVENPFPFMNNQFGLKIVQNLTNKVILSWNTNLFEFPQFKKCLTSAELVDDKGNVTALDISKEEVAINVYDCSATKLTVKYKYKETVFMTKAKVIHVASGCPSKTVVSGKLTSISYKSGLLLLLVVILVVGMAILCKKKQKISTTTGIASNRVDCSQDRDNLPEVD